MAEYKYEYLKATGIVRDSIYPPFLGMIFYALKDANFQIRFTHVNTPYEMKEQPHKHDFDEVFVFVPCSEDLKAYDAESEIYFGEKGEKLIIKETCAVHIPAGQVHCPIVHKRVGTPFFFVNCPITPEYSAIIGGKKLDVPVDKEIFDKKKWEDSKR
jgi:mannose-6-phosphate isomerase-like protein (cupin superfamily)